MPLPLALSLLALAGAVGTVARWGTVELCKRVFSEGHWWASVLVVNIIGCFLFGLVWSLTYDRHALNDARRLVILTGFMGAYTTFSTFAFDSAHLLETGRYDLAVANMFLQNALGVAAVFGGFAVARWWV